MTDDNSCLCSCFGNWGSDSEDCAFVSDIISGRLKETPSSSVPGD